jgi:hypothetical protein
MSDEAIPLPPEGISTKSLYEDIYRLKKEIEELKKRLQKLEE